VWELFSSFLANETFAHEMDISLVPLNESDIPHVESNPKLKDGMQRPVRPHIVSVPHYLPLPASPAKMSQQTSVCANRAFCGRFTMQRCQVFKDAGHAHAVSAMACHPYPGALARAVPAVLRQRL